MSLNNRKSVLLANSNLNYVYQSWTIYLLNGYNKDRDQLWTFLFNGYSNGGYCMTTKMARVFSVCSPTTSVMDTSYACWASTISTRDPERNFTETLSQGVSWEMGCNRNRTATCIYTPDMTSESSFSCPCIQPSLLLSTWCAGSVCSVCMTPMMYMSALVSVPIVWGRCIAHCVYLHCLHMSHSGSPHNILRCEFQLVLIIHALIAPYLLALWTKWKLCYINVSCSQALPSQALQMAAKIK